MKKNGKYYLPYLLTCIGAAAMFYILFFSRRTKASARCGAEPM